MADNEQTENDAPGESHASVRDSLRLGGGFQPSEFDSVVAQFRSLDARLRSFAPGSVELQLTMKERDTPSQRTTLEAWIAGRPRLVATSTAPMFVQALAEVRDDLIRQITGGLGRNEPRNARRHRDTRP